MRAHRLLTTGLATLGVLAAVSLLSSAPAFAAAPETPVTEAPTANTTGTTATLNGELNPGLATEKVTYRFAYSAGSSAACTESGLTAPGEPFPEAEGSHEKVSTSVTGLEGSTEYTVCVIAANPAEPAESTQGNSVTFKTPTTRPVVESQGASGFTPLDATLEGQVNPENQETTYHLEYATNSSFTANVETLAYGIVGPGISAVQPVGPVDLGGALTPDTTYYYRVVAKNASGETKGTVAHPFEEFKTEALKEPSIDSESVTGVTQTNAELHAAINPEYQETEYQFKLGTSVAYGVEAPAALTGLGGAGFFGDIEPVVNLNGEAITLAPNTEYHYQAVATNPSGSTEGLIAQGDKHFLTLPNPPAVITGEASELAPTTATIAGSVNTGATGHAEQDDTTYSFQYGLSTGYGEQTPQGDAGEGTSPVPEQAALTGLEPGSTYHYRILATNNNHGTPQTVYGKDQTFTTVATPPVLGEPSATEVTQSTASINGTLDPRGLPTRWELRAGTTPGNLVYQASGSTSSSGALPLAVSLQSLSPGTTYYYKLIAVNPDGTVESTEAAFTTAAAPNAVSSLTQPPTPLLTLPNVAFPNEAAGTTTPKSLTRAQKLTAALKACHKDHNKAKRQQCVRAARTKFGPVKKAKKGGKKK